MKCEECNEDGEVVCVYCDGLGDECCNDTGFLFCTSCEKEEE